MYCNSSQGKQPGVSLGLDDMRNLVSQYINKLIDIGDKSQYYLKV